jgi:hypothetical protein
LPHKNLIIFAFFTFHFYGLHSFDLLIFFGDDGHEWFGFGLNDCAGACFSFSVSWLLSKIAFRAAQHKPGSVGFSGFKTATACWTKLHELESSLTHHKEYKQDIRLIFLIKRILAQHKTLK